jgi:uncharacterized protein YkwD
MRRALSLLALTALGAMALPVTSAIAADCQGVDARPAADNLPLIAQTTLCLLNNERAAAGLAPVAEQQQLTQASADFSALMVQQRFFAHVSPGGVDLTTRLTTAGYLGRPGSWMVGENIAWGESYLATPANIVKAWMNSPPHKANILNGDFEEIGLGIVPATPLTANAGATYTTDFGRRRLDAGSETTAGLEVARTTPQAPGSAPRSGTKSKTQVQRRSVRRKACKRLRRTRGARRAAVRIAPRKSCSARTKARAKKQRAAKRA